jgi:hypothetical protein
MDRPSDRGLEIAVSRADLALRERQWKRWPCGAPDPESGREWAKPRKAAPLLIGSSSPLQLDVLHWQRSHGFAGGGEDGIHHRRRSNGDGRSPIPPQKPPDPGSCLAIDTAWRT